MPVCFLRFSASSIFDDKIYRYYTCALKVRLQRCFNRTGNIYILRMINNSLFSVIVLLFSLLKSFVI
jgi:hypothetical protein